MNNLIDFQTSNTNEICDSLQYKVNTVEFTVWTNIISSKIQYNI